MSDPVASFTATPNPTAVANTISFDATGSSAAGSRTIASYLWDWGDGSAAGAGVTATHNYTTSGAGVGTYTVTLTVTDSAGATGQTTVDVTVN
ncbi:MAG: PKD domain-containing protein [Acidobacteria bacterium]|nr:PKD domain-containing protein [Acidobacteriota bacterium]